ncbi:MAG: hypothetical protein V3S07_02425, partial [Micropepsaceae bacterium]
MTMRIFVPSDAAALSMGADDVAHAVTREIAARKLDATLIRNGSRGMMWLEPLLEVETPAGRIGYGPVQASDVKAIFKAGLGEDHGLNAHSLNVGLVEEIPFLKNQQRLTFARCGITDPLSVDDYESHDGLKGLRNALDMTPDAIVAEVIESGLRGRGGAGFPTGIKWRTVLQTEAPQKY